MHIRVKNNQQLTSGESCVNGSWGHCKHMTTAVQYHWTSLVSPRALQLPSILKLTHHWLLLNVILYWHSSSFWYKKAQLPNCISLLRQCFFLHLLFVTVQTQMHIVNKQQEVERRMSWNERKNCEVIVCSFDAPFHLVSAVKSSDGSQLMGSPRHLPSAGVKPDQLNMPSGATHSPQMSTANLSKFTS